MAFSYYSYRAEVHDAVTRTPNSHALTTRAFQRAIAAGIEVRAAVIVMEENVADVAHTVAHLRSMGVTSIDAAPGRAVGRGQSFHGELPAELWNVGHSAHGGGSGGRALGKLAVSSDGNVYPCIFNRSTRLGSVHERSLIDVVRAPEVKRSLLLATDEDDREKLQCGSCRLTANALRACSRRLGRG